MADEKKVERTPQRKPQPGRPRIPIDWEQFDRLCQLQCTQEEMASYFDCSVDTIDRAVRRDHGMSFAEYFALKRGRGKIALRRAQFRLAEKSAAMAIFLGVNYLGQTNERVNPQSSAPLDNVKTIAELMNNPAPVRQKGDEELS